MQDRVVRPRLIEPTVRAMGTTLRFYRADWEPGCARQSAFTPYPGPEDLLAALGSALETALDKAEVGRVVAALCEEHQQRRGPLWQTLLVIAFKPALVRVRAIWPFDEVTEDHEQDVFVAFLETIRLEWVRNAKEFSPRALRLEVRRSLLGDPRKKKEEEPEELSFDEEIFDGGWLPAAQRRAKERVDALLAALTPEMSELLMAIHGYEESLTDFIAAKYPKLDEKGRKAVYQRLWKESSLVMKRLRKSNDLDEVVATPKDFGSVSRDADAECEKPKRMKKKKETQP